MRFATTVALISAALATFTSVLAQTDNFLGEIKIWPINFPPRGWAFCNGATLAISQNQALFALLGTTYGGNGQTTFNLPDLRGRFPIGANPMGGSNGNPGYNLGQTGDASTTTLTTANLPPHVHGATFAGAPGSIQVNSVPGQATPQANGNLAMGSNSGTGQANIFAANAGSSPVNINGFIPQGAVNIAPTGNGQPINNIPNYNTFNYIIALQGIFPSQN